MGIDSILAEIDAEIARLTEARSLLAGMGSVSPASTKGKAAKKAAKKAGKKRVLSPEARKRIADAQRKRWAAQRAKAKAK
jgi:sugar/nucleoside kinase (ribokinase family)